MRSVWGKIIGGLTGYALEGAWGSIVGATAGHAVDVYTSWAEQHVPHAGSSQTNGQERRNPGSRYVFTLAVVTLGAKLAKVDGAVVRAEIDAFKEVFRVPPEELRNVGQMFDRARVSARGYEAYAAQLAELLQHNHSTLDEIIGCLFHVATADGPLKIEEADYIKNVAHIFGFSDSYFQRRLEETIGHRAGSYSSSSSSAGAQGQQQGYRAPPPEAAIDPYAVLGIAATSSDKEIKIRYRTLVRENHPDSLVAAGKSGAAVATATAKLARINAAYDQILKERHIG